MVDNRRYICMINRLSKYWTNAIAFYYYLVFICISKKMWSYRGRIEIELINM